MLTIKDYCKAESLAQAYELNQKRSNRVMGGMLWLRTSRGTVSTIIDLSGLGLNRIREGSGEFSIGCMTTLRELEIHPGLHAYTQGALRESLRHIVGVQFRNLATVGGSLFGRYGFSDVLTLFLALDSYVELYRGGVVPLEEFSRMKADNDILVRLIVKKHPCHTVYLSHRNTKTDFPTLTCAVSEQEGRCRTVIGARPGRAIVLPESSAVLADGINEESARAYAEKIRHLTPTGSNMRGSAAYRSHLTEVLTRRAVLALGGNTLKEKALGGKTR